MACYGFQLLTTCISSVAVVLPSITLLLLYVCKGSAVCQLLHIDRLIAPAILLTFSCAAVTVTCACMQFARHIMAVAFGISLH